MFNLLKKEGSDLKYLQLMLDFGFDVNHKSHDDLGTLLHATCMSGNLECV